MLIYRKPQPYRFLFDYISLASNSHKAMLIGWKWPVQIVLIHFGTQVLLRSIAPRSLTVEGFVPTLELVILSSSCSEWMLLLIPPMRRCNKLCNSALFVLWYYRCMDVVFDWNLGNMIYNGLITLRRCGFPFMEIEVVSVGIRAILDHRTKPSEMDDRIGREQPFFRLYTDPAFTFMQGLSINWPTNTCFLKTCRWQRTSNDRL